MILKDKAKISLALPTIPLCIRRMIKRAHCAVAAIAAIFLLAAGVQSTRAADLSGDSFAVGAAVRSGFMADRIRYDQPDVLRRLNSSYLRPSPLTLSAGPGFSLADAFGWLQPEPYDVVAPSNKAERRRDAIAGRVVEPASKTFDLRRVFDYAGGEVGFMYGKSTGRFGGEYTRAYIIGEVGNDKVQITAGASYEESNVRFPRSRR